MTGDRQKHTVSPSVAEIDVGLFKNTAIFGHGRNEPCWMSEQLLLIYPVDYGYGRI